MSPQQAQKPKKTENRHVIIGGTLLVISCVLWVSLLAVPFIPLPGASQIVLGTGILLLSEITFWFGVAYTGKTLIRKHLRYLNPKRWKRAVEPQVARTSNPPLSKSTPLKTYKDILESKLESK